MNEEKYNRTLEIHCPTCTSTHFKIVGNIDDDFAIMTCASCGLSMTKADLLKANSENTEAHLDEIKKQAIQDIRDKLRNTFKSTLRNSKNITFK